MILHVDGDVFFAGCEVARNPALRGRPVVVGAERGVATAVSYEARNLGVLRGMPTATVARKFPSAIFLSGDFALYQDISRRFKSIVREHVPRLEDGGIDECFGEVEGTEDFATLRDELHVKTGVSFSVGVAETKTLAKVASRWKKPGGCVVISPSERATFLKYLPVRSVWGIGRRLATRLTDLRIETAREFAALPLEWVSARFGKSLCATWHELNGRIVHPIETGPPALPSSIQRMRTRSGLTRSEIEKEFARHAEVLAYRLREVGMLTGKLTCTLKRSDFTLLHETAAFPPTRSPSDLLSVAMTLLPRLYWESARYRATGLAVGNLTVQEGLFPSRLDGALAAADKVNRRYGPGAVHLLSTQSTGRRASRGLAPAGFVLQ